MRRDIEDIEKFNALFEVNIQECKNYVEAYDKTEKVMKKQLGRPFYRNFESFSASRRYFIRTHRRNRK